MVIPSVFFIDFKRIIFYHYEYGEKGIMELKERKIDGMATARIL